MTSIDKLRKINEMTKILKQHGIVDSSDDALKQSSEIYEHDSVEPEIKTNDSDLREMENKHRRLSERIAGIESNVSIVIEKMNEMIKVIKRLDGPTQNQPSNSQQTFKEESVTVPAPKPVEKPKTDELKPGNIDIMDFFNYSK